jgi:hypothetical protein
MLNLTKGGLLAALCALTLGAPAAFAQTGVKFNEIQASNASLQAPDGSITDWIELINTTAVPVNLGGASLTDDEADPVKFVFPVGTTVPANGYLIVACDPDRAASAEVEPNLNSGFGLTADGATLFLYENNQVEVLDTISFGNQAPDFSIGLVGNVWRLCNPTRGAANIAATLGSNLTLKVNEWMANPAQGDDDWFELYNPGNLPVSLEGLRLTDTPGDVTTYFPIAPLSFVGFGEYAYVQYIADGNTERGPEHVSFSLRSGGESIAIYDSTGRQIDRINYLAQSGNVSEGRLLDGSATITTFPGTASPARANYKAIPSIVVSEVLAHTDPPLEDAVEFYNNSDADINIGGWYLSNKDSDLKQYRIPNGTKIPAKGYYVFYEGTFNNPTDTNVITPFAFSSARGDQVYLAETDVAGNLTGFRVSEEFEASENGVSMGRVLTSVTNDYKFVPLISRTFGVDNPDDIEDFRTGTGAPNAGPRVGPVVFNEVHFNPLSLDGSDNRDDEFIELHNTTSIPVPLYDPAHPENRWRLQNGVSFVFPGGRTIPAGSYILVVSFDPGADPIGTSHFRSRWRIPTGIQILGPFGGDLNNNGDSLELYKPDPPQLPGRPDAGFVPYTRVDKVNYTDQAPWPSTADGTGFSLQRRNPRTFGNEPLNWDGANPTAGAGNSAELLDTDGDGMTDIWEDANQFNKNNAADATQDADSDTMINRDEFFAGTNPRSATSRLHIKGVTVPRGEELPLTITFVAAANRSYEVQYRDGLDINDDWEKLIDVPSDTFERDVTIDDPEALLKVDRYYRIITK